MSKCPNIAIIYHDADFDGRLSMETCLYHIQGTFPEATIHLYGWDYNRPVPDAYGSSGWTWYDQIYIVDLSVDELMAQPELRDKIVWIDHHKSAIEKWDKVENPNECQYVRRPFTGYRIDGVAACRLCWQWFTFDGITSMHLPGHSDYVSRNVKEPEIIRLAGEYDIWDHRDPNGKILQFGLRALDEKGLRALIHEEFTSTSHSNLNNAILAGKAIKAYSDKQANNYSKDFSHTIKWEGLTFCSLNAGQRGNSDLLKGGIKPEHDACFAWRYTGKEVVVSLYHIDGKTHHVLSLTAVKYGGGGHRGACGFRLSLYELDQLFLKHST